MSNDSSTFIARQSELDQFSSSLSRSTWLGRVRARLGRQPGDPPRVYLPHGIGGVGKTRLARQCPSLACGVRFPDTRGDGPPTFNLQPSTSNLQPCLHPVTDDRAGQMRGGKRWVTRSCNPSFAARQ
jgi:hypothetical protein